MGTLNMVRTVLDRVLAAIVMILVLGVSVVVVLGFTSRLLDASLSWTGEVASTGLAWLTFYGSALAASRGAHIASPSILARMPVTLRVPVTILSEICTIAFLVLLTWTGMQVVEILEGSNLVSLPFISQQLTQSTLPIGAALFILAEVLRFPEILREARSTASDGELQMEDDVF